MLVQINLNLNIYSSQSKNIKFIIPKNSLRIAPWRNGYRRWFPELLRRHSSEGCRFNPHYRQVTGILNTCNGIRTIKDVVRSSVKVPEFD